MASNEQNTNPFGNFDSSKLADPAFRHELKRRRTMLDRFVDNELTAWQVFQRLYRHIEHTQGPSLRDRTPDEVYNDLHSLASLVGIEVPPLEIEPYPNITRTVTQPVHYYPRPGDSSSERYIRLFVWDGDDWDVPVPGILVAPAAEHEYDVSPKEQIQHGELQVVVDYLQGRNFGDFGQDSPSLSSAFMDCPDSEFTREMVGDQERYILWLGRAAQSAGLFMTDGFDLPYPTEFGSNN